MTPHTQMNALWDRIATASSIRRSRTEDASRVERHADREDRLTLVVERLERVADELEKAA